MVEIRQNLPLVAKSAQHFGRVHAAFDDLDRDSLVVLIVIAFSQVDSPHTAVADFANDAIIPQARAQQRRALQHGPGLHFDGRGYRNIFRLIGAQQRLDLAAQLGIPTAGSG